MERNLVPLNKSKVKGDGGRHLRSTFGRDEGSEGRREGESVGGRERGRERGAKGGKKTKQNGTKRK